MHCCHIEFKVINAQTQSCIQIVNVHLIALQLIIVSPSLNLNSYLMHNAKVHRGLIFFNAQP